MSYIQYPVFQFCLFKPKQPQLLVSWTTIKAQTNGSFCLHPQCHHVNGSSLLGDREKSVQLLISASSRTLLRQQCSTCSDTNQTNEILAHLWLQGIRDVHIIMCSCSFEKTPQKGTWMGFLQGTESHKLGEETYASVLILKMPKMLLSPTHINEN